ncbi:MAG: LuxR C-terminal-related transcriptional regulator, partial [Nonlabens ulvanivorans]
AMIKKNETLNELKEELNNLPKTVESKSLKKMLDKNLNSKQDWLTFEEAFNNADKDFFKKIKELHPSLTSGDLRLCVYLRLNLSSKEIAPLLNISPRSVEIKRYRLRKKLDLSREDSLTSYIVEI